MYYKVKLAHKATGTSVEFDAAPEITESGAVVYKSVDPVHSPGGILVYTNTSNRTFQLSGIKLFSRTNEEATKNFDRLQIIKSWRYPSFGKTADIQTANTDTQGTYQLGQPPAVLEFSAYSDPNSTGPSGLISKIPVVISNLSIMYPTDCDYIPTGQVQGMNHIPAGLPMPTIFPIDLSLTEAQMPDNYKNFSLSDFRQGKMLGF